MSLTTCRLPDPPAFEGVLEPNNILHKAERIFENELSGPESIVVDGGKNMFIFINTIARAVSVTLIDQRPLNVNGQFLFILYLYFNCFE